MAEQKKISELDFAESVSAEDEFLMIDKSVVTGDEASESGKTSKVTLNQIQDGIFASGLPQGDKGEKGQQGASVTGPQGSQGASVTGAKGQKGQQGASVTGAKGSQGASITGAKGQKGQQGTSVTGPQGSKGTQGTSIKGEPGVGSDGDSFFTQTDNGISYNAGNIAVGTSSTTAKLEVQGDFRVSRNSVYASHWHMGISHTDTSDYGTLGFYSNSDTGDVAFYPNGGEVFRIKKSGEIQYKNGGDDGYSSQVEYIGNDDVKLHFGPNYSFESGFRKTLTLDNNKVGIGTTDPFSLLTVRDRISRVQFEVDPDEDRVLLSAYDRSATTQSGSKPMMYSASKHMFVDGNIGIGTVLPTAQLHIEDENANAPGIKISASDLNYEHDLKANGDGILISADSTNYGGAGPDIRFNVSGSEHMRILQNGNVGIGTNNPESVLEVQGLHEYTSTAENLLTSATKSALRIKGASNSSDSLFFGCEKTNADPYIQASNGVGTNADKPLLINPWGGNVGIGTTEPNMKVNIYHSDQDGLRFSTTNTSTTFIDFGNTDDNDIGQISYSHSDNQMAFKTNNAERMHITSDGNVGIGTDNPGANLEIKGGDEPFVIYDASNEKKLRTFTSSNGTVLALTDGGQDIIRLDGRNTSPNKSFFNAGNIGIGTEDPNATLHIRANDNSENAYAFWVVNKEHDTSIITAYEDGRVLLGSNFEYDTENLTLGGKLIGNQNLASISGSASSVGYELDAEYGLTLGNGVYLGEPKLRIFRGHDEPEQSIEMSAEGITLNNSNNLAESQSSFSIKQKGDDGERVLLAIHSEGSVDMMNTRIAQSGVQIYNEKSIFMQSSTATNASFIKRMPNGLSIFNSATSAGDPFLCEMPFYLSSNYGGLSIVNGSNEEVDLTGRLNKTPEEFVLLEGGQINLAYAGTRPGYVGETVGSWTIDTKPFDQNYAEYDALRFFTKDLNDHIHVPFVVSPNGATVSNRGRFVADDADGVRDILDFDNPLIMKGQEALKVESGNAYQIGVSNLYNNTNIYDDESQTFNGIGKGYMGVDSNGFFRICGNGNNIDNADSAIGTSALGGVGLMDGVDEIARFQSEKIELHNSVTFHDKTTLSAHAAITSNGLSLSKTWNSDPDLRAVVLDSDLGGQSHILGSLGINVSSIGMNNVDKLQVNGSSTLDGDVTINGILNVTNPDSSYDSILKVNTIRVESPNGSGTEKGLTIDYGLYPWNQKIAEFNIDKIVFHKDVEFKGTITGLSGTGYHQIPNFGAETRSITWNSIYYDSDWMYPQFNQVRYEPATGHKWELYYFHRNSAHYMWYNANTETLYNHLGATSVSVSLVSDSSKSPTIVNGSAPSGTRIGILSMDTEEDIVSPETHQQLNQLELRIKELEKLIANPE